MTISFKVLRVFLFSLYKWFHRIRSDRAYDLISSKYISADRMFFYWNKVKFVNSIQMESVPGTYETILLELSKIISIDDTILDYGCWAHKSAYLRELYWSRVSSADILDFDLESFYKINCKDSSLPIQDKKFSISIASEVIEHVYSPFILIDELIRVTKNYIFISTPNPASLRSRKLFKEKWFLYWFAPENWWYHITPVFYWQLERFLQEKNIPYQRYGNHNFFDLEWNEITHAESLIYVIDLRTK